MLCGGGAMRFSLNVPLQCWGALMGKMFAEHGVIFVTPDYRNFPQVRYRNGIGIENPCAIWQECSLVDCFFDAAFLWSPPMLLSDLFQMLAGSDC
jgi:hypothetical protein